MARFEAAVGLSCPHETVFEFLVRPHNVLKTLPPDSGMSYVSAPERIELGSRLEMRLEGMGPVQKIVYEITEYLHPHRFVETQVKGPLQSWIHEHIVESNGSGEVLVIDRIDFEPPGGLAGFLITEARVRDMLAAGFGHRHRELKRLLEGSL